MTVAGLSIILILGVINFCLLLFQLASGLRLMKISPRVHRQNGIVLFVTASFHALLALLAN